MEELVVLVVNDVIFLTRDDSTDGAFFGCPSFRREVGSISGRWGFWAVGVFGHDDKGVGSGCPMPPQKYFSFASKWL